MIARDWAQSVFLVPTHGQLLRTIMDGSHDLSSLDTLFFNAGALLKPLKEWVSARSKVFACTSFTGRPKPAW